MNAIVSATRGGTQHGSPALYRQEDSTNSFRSRRVCTLRISIGSIATPSMME